MNPLSRVGCAALLTIASLCFGVDTTKGMLKGRVVDVGEHAPITQGVYILVHRSGVADAVDDAKLIVNRRGEFSVELEPGLYDVFVSGEPGFNPTCRQVEIKGHETFRFDAVLSVNEEVMQQNRRQ